MNKDKGLGDIKSLFEQSVKVKEKIINDEAILNEIYEISKSVAQSLENGGKILLCGNGGSAADAQHIAAEFVIRLRASVNRKGLPAIALAGDMSSMTACANDYGYDCYYERMVETLGSKEDCLIGFSTSGNSENVLRAFKKAKQMGIKTIGMLGKDGGTCLQACDLAFVVPSNVTERVQESHITAGHAIVQMSEEILLEKNKIEFMD